MNFKNMPPCKPVLMNKILRTNAISRMFKQCASNNTYLPKVNEGWMFGDNGEFSIEYVRGDLYPPAMMSLAEEELASSSDEEYSDTCDDSDFEDIIY